MLKDTIKREYNEARRNKEKSAVNILRVVLGEVESAEKRGEIVGDDFIIAKIRKLIDSNKICMMGGDQEELQREIDVIEKFLPQQLTNEQVRDIVADCKNIGEAMKKLKSEYPGQYDGKTVSTFLKSEVF